MKVFRDGDEPSFELVVFVVGIDFIECFGKSPYGNVLGIVFIFGAKHLKTVHIVPKSVNEVTKGNLVSLFCPLYNLLDGIVGFFQIIRLA